MANIEKRGLSSVFDDMLTQSKRRFDDLYRKPAAPVTASVERAPPSVVPGSKGAPAPPAAAAADGFRTDLPAVRRLKQRFGEEWRFEVSAQRREDDEAVVLGTLVLGKNGATRTQLGRAKIGGAPITGTTGKLQFKLGSAAGAIDESLAFRRAAEAALTNCAELL